MGKIAGIKNISEIKTVFGRMHQKAGYVIVTRLVVCYNFSTVKAANRYLINCKGDQLKIWNGTQTFWNGQGNPKIMS